MGLLNVYLVARRGIRSLGPGLRYGLWLQGCPFNCDACATPEARTVEANKIYTVESVAEDIMASECEGLTISGGEPFLQTEALSELLTFVHKSRPEMTVIIFTGFLKENLKNKFALDVISHTDLLIDGPYIDSLNDGIGLRGSSNQRLWFITDRLLPWKEELETGKRSVEVSFRDGYIQSIGIPLSKT